MAIHTFERFELKFVVPEEKKVALVNILQEYMNPDNYCLNGEKYLIRNIYYDTNDNELIHFSTLKPKYKEKLRARKYGYYGDGKDKVFLEIKKKTKGVVSKRRVTLTSKELELFINDHIVPIREKVFDKQVLREMEYFLSLHPVVPKVFISYERLAFFGKDDSSFRVTFDDNIIARRSNINFEVNEKGETIILPEGFYIMEVKVVNGIPLWFAHALAKLQIYPSSFSKYGKEYSEFIKGGFLNVS